MTARKKEILQKVLSRAAVLLFWIAVWEIAGRLVYAKYHVDFIFPTASATFRTFFSLLGTAVFWKRTVLSVFRIGIGYLFGIAIGIALAFFTEYVKGAKALISPMITVIRATPVASFIMILWVLLQGNGKAVPAVIALLMVMPIAWQNVSRGFSSVDRKLDEVLTVFGVGTKKRMRLLVFPALLDYLVPASVTAAGLAWKAGIAAEIIAYTKDSIGRSITDAKNGAGEGSEMFAWTLAVILLSLLFEQAVKALNKLYKKQKNDIFKTSEREEKAQDETH